MRLGLLIDRFLTSSLIVLTGFSSWAQSITFSGQVRDRQTNQPVEYATVQVWSRDSVLLTGAITDAGGEFTVPNVADPSPRLTVQFMGYQTETIFPTRQPGSALVRLPVVLLLLSEKALKEVIVKGELATVTLQIDKQVVAAKSFQNAANGTGLDLLRRMPNVTVTSEGAIALRGNTGFLVLINGKPSTRAPADVLAQLPANLIENVEIITSPSARYDAEGRAGIINIVTKAPVGQGWSMIGNTLFGGITPTRYGGDLTLTYTAKRWTAYVGGDYRRYDINGFRVGEVRTLVGDTLTYLPSAGIRNYEDYQYAGRAGASFTPNARTSVNLGVYAGYKQTDRTANLHYDEFVRTGSSLNLFNQQWGTPRLKFFNQNLFVRSGSFQAYNLDFTRTFANKSKLAVLGLYEYSVLGGPLTNRDIRENSPEVSLFERSDERSPLTGWRGQADYILPLPNKRRLEMGLQYRSLRHVGDFSFERLNLVTNQFATDPLFADRMDLTQRVTAGYVQLTGETKRLAYNAGLRTEYTDRNLTHRLGKQPFRYDALNLFPSAQLLWTLTKGQKIRLAYTRRIDRPTTKLMAPFQNHRHAETIETGDPNLRPELASVIETSFSQGGSRGTLTLTGYYNRVTDKIFRINTIYNRTILGRTYSNAGVASSVGLEGIADVKLLPGWKAYLSGNVCQFAVRGVADGRDLSSNSLNYNLTANTSLDFTDNLRFQWDLTYLSRTVTVQGGDSDLLLSNMGMKYTLPGGRGSVNLQLLNVFNSNLQTITTEAPLFFSSTDYRKYDRVLQIGLNISLNDSGKKARTVKTEYGEKDF